MKAGRKRTPLATLKARGSSAQYHHIHKEPEPPAPQGAPGCPEFLDREAKAEWRRCIKALDHMKVLSNADRAALSGLCHNWSLWVRLSIKVNGFIERWIGTQEEARIIKAADAAYSNYMRACALFGLTPSDRSRLTPNMEDKSAKGPPSLEDYLKSKTA